jgi:hypothetical protein
MNKNRTVDVFAYLNPDNISNQLLTPKNNSQPINNQFMIK